ncbi:Rha family transcriptional regulator [Polycladidibacter hongkongensis]|uniref:Rha family transcriptional regulator n=1 Tax=Polycladidibacter hongkongensis TaxID=1647556 RepID=UPI00082FDF03|nr:Rha family transcriptional regulator [Pseudovibrio hongkongensis]
MTDLFAVPANSNTQITMSSKEIAERCNKQHKNVIRDIEKMLDDLSEDRLKFEHISKDSYGRDQKSYLLPKDLTLTLIAGYNVKLRKAIIDRWQELEEQAAQGFKVPKSFKEALRLAADLAEQNEKQQQQIEASKPAVDFVERYVDTSGLKGFRDVCRMLNASERQFKQMLISKDLIYFKVDRNGNKTKEWRYHKEHIRLHRIREKEGEDHGHRYHQARFTAKGVKWISGLWAEYILEQNNAA